MTLRLRLELQRSVREVARALGVSVGVVSSVTSRAVDAQLDPAAVAVLDDTALEAALYGGRSARSRRDPSRPVPAPVWIHTELRRPGVTLELLHTE
jgi:hypothetical protein